MIRKYILFLALFLIIPQVFSQSLPITFSNNDEAFLAFAGSGFAFRSVSPSSELNRGGQFFNDGSNAFQGFYLDFAQPLNLNENNRVFTLRFFSFDPNNHNILLKLEDSANTDAQVQVNFSVPSPSAWIDVTFDFGNAVSSADGSTPVDVIGNYGRMVLFIDAGQTTPGTYIIDDINNGATAPPNQDDIDFEYTELVWSDEFDGPNGAIDASKWHHQTELPAGGNWYNGELQHYTNRIDNSKIENGFLIITAKKENFTNQGYTKEYTSARLNSKFAFTYGRVDVRARLPFGNGTWPAIWTLGKNINEDGAYWDNQGYDTTSWPACGEIDIMEHGLHAVNEVSSAIHSPSSFGNTMNTEKQFLSDVANEFHTYSMNWSPNKIVFLVDDVPFYTYNPINKDASTWPFTEDQYLLLNIAMGGIAGTIDSNFTQSEMVIDYVRVYQESSLSSVNSSIAKIKVHPNPASENITISSTGTIDTIRLYNILGQLVSVNRNTKTIDVSNLEKGIYILKISSGNMQTERKVTVY
ncbi:family 16 glycosylhydrolase [Winogradskyella litorisediminis]|uniref:Family 16 glycosylhydrolase n=1 Tax=Winogradskyella litorisediminis TaxID=1156618 RepID=A0ABW3N611_9FLAO